MLLVYEWWACGAHMSATQTAMWNPFYLMNELCGPQVCNTLGMILYCLIFLGLMVLLGPYAMRFPLYRIASCLRCTHLVLVPQIPLHHCSPH